MLTNKYAEGYPGGATTVAASRSTSWRARPIDRAKSLFGAQHANVQPHAGAQANNAVFHAMMSPGDRIMGLTSPTAAT